MYIHKYQKFLVLFACPTYDKVDKIALKDKIDLKDNYWDDKYIFV